jgi:hypothetical protein
MASRTTCADSTVSFFSAVGASSDRSFFKHAFVDALSAVRDSHRGIYFLLDVGENLVALGNDFVIDLGITLLLSRSIFGDPVGFVPVVRVCLSAGRNLPRNQCSLVPFGDSFTQTADRNVKTALRVAVVLGEEAL